MPPVWSGNGTSAPRRVSDRTSEDLGTSMDFSVVLAVIIRIVPSETIRSSEMVSLLPVNRNILPMPSAANRQISSRATKIGRSFYTLPSMPSITRSKRRPTPKSDFRIPTLQVGVVDAQGGETRWLEISRPGEDSYFGQVSWAGNSDELLEVADAKAYVRTDELRFPASSFNSYFRVSRSSIMVTSVLLMQ